MSEATKPASDSAAPSAAVEWRHVSKWFGETRALHQVSLRVQPGEIHALAGENGAGKSTLLKILAGIVRHDDGQLLLDGVERRFRNAAEAALAGVGVVHQHFMLVPPFTVAENILLGAESAAAGFLSRDKARDRVKELSKSYHLPIDPDARVETLGVGERQRVEILKALHREARVMAFDEPTAVLAPQEVDSLLRTLLDLKEAGRTILLVTHKLDEVLQVADRVTVVRRGELVGTVDAKSTTAAAIAEMMVGRVISLPHHDAPDEGKFSRSASVLELRGIRATGSRGEQVLNGFDLSVRPGEIVGIAGVEGNGQAELAEVIAGVRRPTSGRITLNGIPVNGRSVLWRRANGLGFIPEDRHRQALALDLSVTDNLVLGRPRESKKLRASVDAMLQEYDVRPALPLVPARGLSGGNQQKLVAARELSRDDLKVLVAAQPTRGVDLGAIEFLRKQLLELSRRGVGIVLISSELEEILDLSTKVVVINRGRVVFEQSNVDLDERQLGFHMCAAGTT